MNAVIEMKPYNTLFIIFIIILFVYGKETFAGTKKEPVQLDTVIVTAKKTDDRYQTGDVDMEQTPADYSMIERDQFEGKMEDLAQVIEKEAGVQIRRTGGLGSYSAVSLRGSSSDQVMVYMDGILLNDASGGGVDLSNISLSDVQSIEIYQGTTPINYGNASIGGVVNIKTLPAEDGFKSNVGAGYGSFNTRDFSGFVNYKKGKWSCLTSAEYLASNNDYEITNDNGTPLNPDDDREEKRNNAQFDQHNLLAKFGFDFSGNHHMDVINQFFSKDQRLPRWDNSENADASFDTRRNISTIKFIANDLGSLNLNTATSFSYLHKNEVYRDLHSDIGLGSQHSEYLTKRYGGEFYVDWASSIQTAVLVMDGSHEEYEPEDLLSGVDPNHSSRSMLGIGIQDSLILFEEVVIISPALRYTCYNDELKSGQDPLGKIQDGISRNEGYMNPQIGIKVKPVHWLAIKSNLNQYDRIPSFFELFGDRGFFMSNYELKKETGVNFDTGIEINKKIERGSVDRFSANVTYFQSSIDDLITRVYDARGIGKSVNISSADIKGVELGCKLDLFQYFRLTGNATFQDPVNHSKIKGFDGKKLPGQFQEKYLGMVEVHYNQWKLFAEYSISRGMYYDTANLLEAEDQENITTGISRMLNNWLVSVEARNITDNHYEDFNGYPMPGISYYVKVKYGF